MSVLDRAMVFVDGTNLFHRLEASRLRVPDLSKILPRCIQNRQLVRAYLYTSEPFLNKAKSIHGENFAEKFRIVLGDAPRTKDGNHKEKGVDALLVADMVYHAASKNFDFAILVSVDTDFVFAIRRVEDFGCRSKVVGICAEVPERLKDASDSHVILDTDWLIQSEIAFMKSDSVDISSAKA